MINLIKEYVPELITGFFIIFIIYLIVKSNQINDSYEIRVEQERAKYRQQIENEIYNFLMR